MKIDKNINCRRAKWTFDTQQLSKNFDIHASKSIPFYHISHDICLKLSEFYLDDNSICYDLGCSNGSLLKKIQKKIQKKIRFIGVDSSKEMIKLAKKNSSKIDFKCQNLNKIKFKRSDLILSLYTMQFIKPKYRQQLLNKIYKSLNWGGAYIYFTKIRGNDARFQDILNFSYFDFKQENGLNPLEILNKEISLRSVMEPYTIKENIFSIKRAGFKDVMTISQHLNFIGFLAIK
jgi:tRNA (cmo5U34)-methyltransferase